MLCEWGATHAQDPLPNLSSCSDDLLKQVAFSYSSGQGYAVRMCCSWSCHVYGQWFSSRPNCCTILAIASSVPFLPLTSAWSLWTSDSCFSAPFTPALQYLGDGTSVFHKQRYVPLWVASAEQRLSGDGLPFPSNAFPELLQNLGRAIRDLRLEPPQFTFIFTCKPWQFVMALSAGPGGTVGSNNCPFNNQPHAASKN